MKIQWKTSILMLLVNFAHLAEILVGIAPQQHGKSLCEYSDRQKVGSRCVLQAKVIDTTSGEVFGVRKTV